MKATSVVVGCCVFFFLFFSFFFCLTRSGLPLLVRGNSTDNIKGDVYNSSFKTERALVRG